MRESPPANNDPKTFFLEPNIQMWREMAMFIKSHMKIQRLTLNIGGWVAQGNVHLSSGDYMLQTARHPEIEELLALPPVERLSILWTSSCFPTGACSKHTSWCFAQRKQWPCGLATESLVVSSFIKSIRDRLLPSRQQLGLSQIRGGLVFPHGGQQHDNAYIVMETDDSCSDTSHLTARPVSHLPNRSQNITSPRWPGDITCMEMVSNDFHASLRHSRYLMRPHWEEVTFHFVWIDSLTASNAILALDCEDFWRSRLVRKVLGFNVEAPPFATNTVTKGYDADPRSFDNYGQWRDRLRHLLQLSRWTLRLEELFFLPRTVDQSELNLSLFRTPHHQQYYFGGPSGVLAIPDTSYPQLLRAVTHGEADQ